MKERLTKALLLAAALAVLSSVFFPYWKLKVTAPQYPKGLKIAVFMNRVTGDVQEIDTLNHYIGMRPLKDAAKTERKMALPGVLGLAAALVAAAFIRRKAALLLLIPVIVFPAVFAVDLYYWLREFGMNLDPHAPLSSSVKPFVPPLWGAGKIAQFQAHAAFALGHSLCVLAAALAFAALLLKLRRAKLALVAAFLLSSLAVSSARAEEIRAGAGGHPTIQGALVAARDGDTVLVAPGTYEGPIVVKKSVSLVGEGRPVIDGKNRGTVVSLEAPDVTFRGFVVKNSGDILTTEDGGVVARKPRARIEDNRLENVLFGIYLHSSPKSVVKGNTLTGKKLDVARRGDLIRAWSSDGARIEGNRTSLGRDVVLWFSKDLTIVDNEVSDARYGLHFMYCRNAVVERNRLFKNSVGAYLMYSEGLVLRRNLIHDNRGPSGYGVGFKDMVSAVAEENVVVNNRVGFFLDSSTAGKIERNVVAYNDTGLQVFPTVRRNAFRGNNLVDNAEQTALDGSSVYTVNDWNGNYWSDYRGYDKAGDGTGDVAYRPMKLFERLTDCSQALKIFSGSPAAQAIDFAAATFPVFSPVPKFTDEKPLMRPVVVAGKAAPASAAAVWTMASLGLLLPSLGFLRI